MVRFLVGAMWTSLGRRPLEDLPGCSPQPNQAASPPARRKDLLVAVRYPADLYAEA